MGVPEPPLMMDVYRASLRQSASMQRGSMSGTSDYDMCVNRGATANNYGDASGYSPRARVNINSANPYTRNQPQPYGHVTDGAPGALGYGQQMSEREREFIRNKPPRQTVTQSAWLSPRELHTHTHTHTHIPRKIPAQPSFKRHSTHTLDRFLPGPPPHSILQVDPNLHLHLHTMQEE
jgi:hypothetical protein